MCDVTWNAEPNNTCERRRHGDKWHIVRRCVSGNRDTPFCYGNEENSHHAEIVLAQIYKHGGL